ncbi:MAG: Ig-like domain-containing protein, partial [Terriglobia bacterium]
DMRALRDAQQPDFKGNKIPRAAIDGSITWVRGTNVPVMGRLMVIDRHQGMASSYDCNTCPCPMDDLQITVKPSSGSLIPGSTLQFTATDEAEDCNDILHYYDETPQSSWRSQTPSICTVSGGLAKGVSGGSATITATYAGQYCTYDPLHGNCVCTPNTPQGSATITVQKPTFLLRLSSSCNPYTCGTGDGATQINELVYRVLDQNRNGINVAGMTIAEQATQTQNTCPVGEVKDALTWPTDSSGIMIGADYLWGCQKTGTNCTSTFSQYFKVTALGIPYPVQVKLSNGTVGSHNVIGYTFSNGVGSCPTCNPSP